MWKRNAVKRMMRAKKQIGSSRRAVLCAVILLAAVVFRETGIASRFSGLWEREMDYAKVVSAVGRALNHEGDVIQVFHATESKAPKPTSPAIEITSAFYMTQNQQEKGDAVPAGLVSEAPLSVVNEQSAIEQLSFEMSREELADDTKAEPFEIPPPSYCSYKKIDLGFSVQVPVYGAITSPFGYRDHPVDGDASFHTGMDIAAASGTPVNAFAAGKVLEAGSNKTYGNYVLLEHQNGIRSFYGHNSQLCVKAGQSVKRGQTIAKIGSTGLSTGPHLHFEVRSGNVRLNPRHYIAPERL